MTWRSQTTPVGVILPVAGQRKPLQLINGKLGKYLTITISAQVDVSVAAATSIRNRGLASALIDEFLLIENGENRHELTGKAMRVIGQANAPSGLSTVPVLTTAVQAGTIITETLRMFFRWPMAHSPDETAFIERDQRQGLFFSVRMVANPAAALFVVGGATVAVTNVSCTVEQDFHMPDSGTVAPYFIPVVRQAIANINGGITKQAEYIRTTNLIRAIVVSQEVDGNEVSDILTGLSLRGDTITPIGPGAVPWLDLLRASEYQYGGAMIPSNLSHLFLGFQEDGLLSNCLNPRQDTNLRFELAGAPSATAGQSAIRFTYCELEHTSGITSLPPFPY